MTTNTSYITKVTLRPTVQSFMASTLLLVTVASNSYASNSAKTLVVLKSYV